LRRGTRSENPGSLIRFIKKLLAILLSLPLTFNSMAALGASPAEMISDFRIKQGEGRVTMDSTLNRIALDQAKAMAAREKLDHEVLGSFNSRVAPARAGRAAENIAYGFDNFSTTLVQWIDSPGHRKNLLLPKASRVGVASARSPNSRTYWAMVIAGDYEKPATAAAKKSASAAKQKTAVQSCRIKILSVCF